MAGAQCGVGPHVERKANGKSGGDMKEGEKRKRDKRSHPLADRRWTIIKISENERRTGEGDEQRNRASVLPAGLSFRQYSLDHGNNSPGQHRISKSSCGCLCDFSLGTRLGERNSRSLHVLEYIECQTQVLKRQYKALRGRG